MSDRRPAIAGALLALICCAALTSATASAAAPAPRVNITDIEDEVMCTICGTLLELADSPQAQREKAFIAEMIAAGKTKAEIKDTLVNQYGPEVLALPDSSGFNLSAYLVPAVAFLIAIVALALGVRRWRREGGGGPKNGAAATPPPDEDTERLDADIARYDL